MAVMDSIFWNLESREHPTHFAKLQLFRPPADAGPEFVSEFYRELLTHTEVDRLMRRRPVRSATSLGQWSWTEDEEVDLEYHVRLTALPYPGRVRELLALVSRLHGTLLDRHRPLWECYVIEGLEDGRFAVYTKLHHALMDGVAGMQRLTAGLSTDVNGKARPPWAPQGDAATSGPGEKSSSGLLSGAWDRVRSVGETAANIASAQPALVRALRDTLRDDTAALPFQAPKSMLNVKIAGARRIAAQNWPLSRVKAVAKASGATINDVAVAMCAGALRRYLLDNNALPDKALVALLPVSMRGTSLAGSLAGGDANKVGGILCDLATNEADPARRLERIHHSTQNAKTILKGMNSTEMGLMTLATAGGIFLSVVPGLPPAFNVIISNVPGSRDPLYWNGAELTEGYPMSVIADGQALNMTLISYNGQLSFGLVGCRRSLPHMQRLLEHLDNELGALEKAVA
jgi:WS/DGAT/MGAT family acyltransferase